MLKFSALDLAKNVYEIYTQVVKNYRIKRNYKYRYINNLRDNLKESRDYIRDSFNIKILNIPAAETETDNS